jgi:predicted RNase H-like nuclease (RuvC/YqgF family)
MAKTKAEIDNEIMQKRSMVETLKNQIYAMSDAISEKEVDKCFKKISKLNRELDSLRKESRKILNHNCDIVKDANLSVCATLSLRGF